MKIEYAFQAAAAVLVAAAAYFYWRGHSDGAFAAFALACAAFFLNMRFRMSARNKSRAAEQAEETEVDRA